MFRRAAELEAAGAVRSNEAVLDLSAVEAIGRDAGLSPASVRAAVYELRAGGLGEIKGGQRIPWGTVVSSRVIMKPANEVVIAVDELARRNLLTLQPSRLNETVWTRSAGIAAATARRLGGRRRHPLSGLRELRCMVTEPPSGPARPLVQLEGSLIFPWRLLPLRSQVIAAGGAAGGTAVLAFGLPISWHTEAINAAGALGAVGASAIGLRAHRDAVATIEAALDHFLDRLERGAPTGASALPSQ